MLQNKTNIDLSNLDETEQDLIIMWYELDNQNHQLFEIENEFGFTGDSDGLKRYVKSVMNKLPELIQKELKSL